MEHNIQEECLEKKKKRRITIIAAVFLISPRNLKMGSSMSVNCVIKAKKEKLWIIKKMNFGGYACVRL